MHRELQILHADESGSEFVDGIVRRWQRAMAATVLCLEVERHVAFFGSLDRIQNAAAIAGLTPSGIGVDAEFGID